MRPYVPVLIAALLAAGFLPILPSGTPTHPAKKSAPSHSTSTKKGATSTKRRRHSTARARPGWRASQQSPTPERYKEIQQALMQRGYLSGAASGVWDAQSMEAMKRFQREQDLTPTGKPSALALIALGLGPKRDPKTQNGQSRQGLSPEATSGVKK